MLSTANVSVAQLVYPFENNFIISLKIGVIPNDELRCPFLTNQLFKIHLVEYIS